MSEKIDDSVLQSSETDNKKKKGKWLRILLILLLLLLMGSCFGYRYLAPKEADDTIQREMEAKLGMLPGLTEEERQKRVNQVVKEEYFNVSMNGIPTFKNGRSKGNVNIENIKANHYSFTVTVTVQSVDAEKYPEAAEYVGQTVLTTGMLDPDTYLAEKKLDVNLPKGEYLSEALFTAYKINKDEQGNDTQEVFGNVRMQVVLDVQS